MFLTETTSLNLFPNSFFYNDSKQHYHILLEEKHHADLSLANYNEDNIDYSVENLLFSRMRD
jgi:hypothetical protein